MRHTTDEDTIMKIGRNDPCPCGSGKKFKRCCLGKKNSPLTAAPQPSVAQQRLSLLAEVEKTQQAALARQYTLRSLGVFIFLTTENGDGWVLEITEMDALQVAANGEKIEVEIAEGEETIEINWSHTFRIHNKRFETTAYSDNTVTVHDGYPAMRIKKAIDKARARFPKELLAKVHLSSDEEP